MKLADISALDGAISNIRLWSLGDLDNKILPTKAAINKLRNILASNVGGGTMDLVWGPELKFTESSTQVFRFLGKESMSLYLPNICRSWSSSYSHRNGFWWRWRFHQ